MRIEEEGVMRYLSALVHLTTLARTRKQSTRRQFYMSLANSHGITSEFSSDSTPFRWIPGQVSSLLFAYFAETVVAKFFYPFLPKAIASLLLSSERTLMHLMSVDRYSPRYSNRWRWHWLLPRCHRKPYPLINPK